MKNYIINHFQLLLISSLFNSITPAFLGLPNEQIRFQSPFSSKPQATPSLSPSRLPKMYEIFHTNTLSNLDYILFKHHLKSNPEKRLIRWSDGHQEWITEGEKALIILSEKGRKFVDVTEWNGGEGFVSHCDIDRQNFLTEQLDDRKPQFPLQVKLGRRALQNFLDRIQVDRMRSRLAEFTGFRTRYYRSATGRESQAWLLNLINSLVSKSSSNVTVSEFPHKWGQNSIIVRFEPHSESNITDLKSTSTFIVGAHQDSTNFLPFLPAPGADDDGSGTMSILESLTILLEQNWSPSVNQGAIEFMWFSAEEGGLLGSQEIARHYQAKERNLQGMVQFDMTAFVKKGTEPNIGLVTDFVHPSLTQYLRILIDEYCSISWIDTKCGYACSDHASFNQINTPSAFAIESSFELSNHKIHSIEDKFDFDEFSFEHMAEFSKLVLGLVAEVGGS